MNHQRIGEARVALLKEGFLENAELLWRRRAADIPSGYLDDYVRLGWLQWHGGSLRLTPPGEQMSHLLRTSAELACAD